MDGTDITITITATPMRVRDPVCGMTVDPAKTAHHATHEGRDFHFAAPAARPGSRPIPRPISAPSTRSAAWMSIAPVPAS